MREIAAGEAITFDYAMSDTKAIFAFDCWCGSAKCRKQISGDDWRLADLQERYSGWFAPHVARLIKQSQP
jgi:hypothetical protein